MNHAAVPLPDAARAAASHGSWCPKMCTFACPVATATGRDDAVPWSFHRVVDDLATGRMSHEVAAHNLRACTGCMACQDACVHGQDVPAQVRAGRALVGMGQPEVQNALDVIRIGGRFAEPAASVPADDATIDPVVTLHVSCTDEPAAVDAALALMQAAADGAVAVRAPGCCGQQAVDVGGVVLAEERREVVGDELRSAGSPVVALGPHCLPSLRAAVPDLDVTDLWTFLERRLDRLAWQGEPLTVAYHDPCQLARVEGVTAAPRALLAAAGVDVVEPEHHGTGTFCAGGGMGLPLVDPAAAAATASVRREQLDATGAMPVTACARARTALSTPQDEAVDLAVLLASRLEPR